MFKKVIFGLILFGMGCGTGWYIQKRISYNPEHAINVIQNQPGLTWRLKYFSSGQYSLGGRDGLWVTRFKPRYTGIMAYVLFHKKNTGQSYLLLTLQERVVNQKTLIVCEPPTGFFNGEYVSSIPHLIAEAAERKIEKQYKLGIKNIDQRKIYNDLIYQYNKDNRNEMTRNGYKMDVNLQETAYREIEEEAGLDIRQLQKDGFSLSQTLLGEIETPDVYTSIRRIDIFGDSLPPLKKRDNEEVRHNEWVLTSNIDLKERVVKTSRGTFPLKPYDQVIESVKQIMYTLSEKL